MSLCFHKEDLAVSWGSSIWKGTMRNLFLVLLIWSSQYRCSYLHMSLSPSSGVWDLISPRYAAKKSKLALQLGHIDIALLCLRKTLGTGQLMFSFRDMLANQGQADREMGNTWYVSEHACFLYFCACRRIRIEHHKQQRYTEVHSSSISSVGSWEQAWVCWENRGRDLFVYLLKSLTSYRSKLTI